MKWKRLSARIRRVRGSGADATIKCLGENWDEWKAAMQAIDDEERQAMCDKFEEACSGAGEAITYETSIEFHGEADSWNAVDKEAFEKILLADYFDCGAD